jgi:hypothetical protein
MYGFLFDQTYINLIILGFFLFLIMFLWRKITIIEGNYFILEKRVDMIKKTERDTLISKNMEKADVVMNEIFKDSTGKKNFCNNVSYCPTDAPPKSQKTSSKDTQDADGDADGYAGGDIDTADMSSYMTDAVAAANTAVGGNPGGNPGGIPDDAGIVDVPEDPYGLLESKNKIEIIEYKEDDVVINKNVKYSVAGIAGVAGIADGSAAGVAGGVAGVGGVGGVGGADAAATITDSDIMDIVRDNIEIIETIENVDNMDNDTISVSSDITFGTDQDKSITKRYKKMSIEKLREECIEKSLNSEGTKAILIGRILEYNKKA